MAAAFINSRPGHSLIRRSPNATGCWFSSIFNEPAQLSRAFRRTLVIQRVVSKVGGIESKCFLPDWRQAGSDEWCGLAELLATQFNVCVVFFFFFKSRFVLCLSLFFLQNYWCCLCDFIIIIIIISRGIIARRWFGN